MKFKYGALIFSLLGMMTLVQQLYAHGTMLVPVSRVLQCYNEGPESPDSAACQAMVAMSGPQPLYDWDGINQLPAGNHQAFVPDGMLCSGGKQSFAGLDLPRNDWVMQPVVPNSNGEFDFIYWASAVHRSDYFKFYVTKDSYDPTQPLKWSDLEPDPFCTILGNPPLEGENYTMSCPLPQNKQGRHIIYNVWQRGDSAEAFYSCSDVYFGADMPTPTPIPVPVAGACLSMDWSSVVAYEEGGLARYGGYEWRAKWWTKNDAPGSADVWEKVGECGVVVTPTPTELSTESPATIAPTASATPTSIPPTETPTSIPPSETPTSIPPSETPTSIPPSETPTSVPPTEIPTVVPTATMPAVPTSVTANSFSSNYVLVAGIPFLLIGLLVMTVVVFRRLHE